MDTNPGGYIRRSPNMSRVQTAPYKSKDVGYLLIRALPFI